MIDNGSCLSRVGGRSMGTFFHPITLIGPTGVSETLEALVDTSILFAVIPSPVLKRIGVEPARTVRVGPTRRKRGLAQVEAELAGERGYAMVVFGSARELPRIGRHTLDCFILDVDPVAQKLVTKELRVIWHV